MKKIISMLFIGVLLFAGLKPAWAPTSTTTASFSATVTSLIRVSLGTDANSAGQARVVRFTLRDGDETPPPADPNPGYMYAPTRGNNLNKNWHIVNIAANGTGNVSLRVTAALTGIGTDKFKFWCGGFWEPGAPTFRTGTKSTAWEAMGNSKVTTGPFTGTAPMNYQLNIATAAPGTYTGTITYTLTQ